MFRALVLAAMSAGALSLPIAASAAPKGCPPGLAKKHNGCNPPGQVKGYGDRDRDDDHREPPAGLPEAAALRARPVHGLGVVVLAPGAGDALRRRARRRPAAGRRPD